MTVPASLDAVVTLTPTDRNGSRVLVVEWNEGGARICAELARLGDIPVLLKVIVENPRELSHDQRTIPTEARVLALVQGLGRDGWPYLLYLMGESLRHEGALSEVTEEVIHGSLDAYRRELFRKPHSRRPELVEVANEMARDGVKTRDIVNTLKARGVSEATAFRYLRRARAGQYLSGTHAMAGSHDAKR